METTTTTRDCMKMFLYNLVLILCFSSLLLPCCDARLSSMMTKNVAMPFDEDSSNPNPYGVASPFSLPPLDSLAPISVPDNNVIPACIYPPLTPLPPSTPTVYNSPPLSPPSPSFLIPPILPIENPPPNPYETIPSPPIPSFNPNPPENVPNPPDSSFNPNPPESSPGPPDSSFSPTPPDVSFNPSPPDSSFNPSPPGLIPSPDLPGPILSPPTFETSPPFYIPSPSGVIIPSPPVFQPPVVFPPPAVPPPPTRGQSLTLWCVAKPSVPDPIIEEAMNYACGSGADCMSIQPNGACYQPNTVFAHASYAFNSYWQRTKVAGGTCEFGGTAILVTVDPSFDGCHFINV